MLLSTVSRWTNSKPGCIVLGMTPPHAFHLAANLPHVHPLLPLDSQVAVKELREENERLRRDNERFVRLIDSGEWGRGRVAELVSAGGAGWHYPIRAPGAGPRLHSHIPHTANMGASRTRRTSASPCPAVGGVPPYRCGLLFRLRLSPVFKCTSSAPPVHAPGEVLKGERDALFKLIQSLRREYESVQAAKGAQDEELRALKERMLLGVSGAGRAPAAAPR